MALPRNNKEKLALFCSAFRGRGDCHGTRDIHNGRASCVKLPPTDLVMRDHLLGRRPVGIYPLVVDKVWFAAIDLDEPDPDLVRALDRLGREIGLAPLIEVSKSKGFHLWFFADEHGWSAATTRSLLHWMTDEVGKPAVEVFPKQDRLSNGSFGNYIYLPLDGRLVREGRTIFVEPDTWLRPFENQWAALAHRERYCAEQLNQIAGDLDISDSDEHDNEHRPASSRRGMRKIPTQNCSVNYGLPPCAQRMLAEGVTEQQRVACFRLAVHLHRVGMPEDIARATLTAWAKKNRPTGGKRVITLEEIAQQTHDGYSGRYRGYGCEDPMVAEFCNGQCPVHGEIQRKDLKTTATDRADCPLKG
ncbi:MAG: TOTE conflict system archaeo-eukaryotic primase domain-containing protein [Phycisphaeraceae bacterium]